MCANSCDVCCKAGTSARNFLCWILWCRFSEESVGMSEFSEEMDDLFFWLDEVNSLLNTGLRPADRDFLQQLSDKLKVM